MSVGKNIELILLLVIATAAGAFGGYMSAQKTATLAPIMVIDIQEYVNKAISDKDGNIHPEKVGQGVKNAEAAAKALAEQGFLVLQKEAVIDAPADYFLAEKSETK